MTFCVRQALADGIKALSPSETDSPRLDVEVLLAHSLGLNREDLSINFDQIISDDQQKSFEQFLQRRQACEPIARILGYKEFWSMDFKLNEATLIPRPDSETLVDAVVNQTQDFSDKQGLKVLDLGTGTGCLLLSVLSEIVTASGQGIDAEPKALLAAKENAQLLGLSNRSVFTQYNWLSGEGEGLGGKKFDILISNPPYIESADIAGLQKEVAGFDPKLALDGGEDGLLHYRVLAKFAKLHLQEGGCFFLEIGLGQALAIKTIFDKQGWSFVDSYKDINSIERVLTFN
jgi:release factor glutamine methyltransferase